MATPAAYAADSCHACERQAGGRCPNCRHGLCIDHFPLDAHEPCATHLARDEPRRICYVCGATVVPQQWSSALFAHHIDAQRCSGCGRHICDARHTRRRHEIIQLGRDGVRSNRYHVIIRICDVCAPIHRLGGLVGATWWAVGLAMVGSAAMYLFAR